MEVTVIRADEFDIFYEDGFIKLLERANGFVRLLLGGELRQGPFEFNRRIYHFSAFMEAEGYILQLAYSGVPAGVDTLGWRLDLELFRIRKSPEEFAEIEPSKCMVFGQKTGQKIDCVFRATRRPKEEKWKREPSEDILPHWRPEMILPLVVSSDWFTMQEPAELTDAQVGMLIFVMNVLLSKNL